MIIIIITLWQSAYTYIHTDSLFSAVKYYIMWYVTWPMKINQILNSDHQLGQCFVFINNGECHSSICSHQFDQNCCLQIDQ